MYSSSNSISMLPSDPKIFHGRDSELSNILQLFSRGTPRIAILGPGGMGKTSLARAVIHHTEITERYNQHRFFVACDSAATQVELAALIGAHIGLKPEKDLTHPVIQYFSSISNCLLIVDNLETSWEPVKSRGNIEEFLSLLTGVDQLALVILQTTHDPEQVDKVLSLTDNLPLAISLIAHLLDSEGCSHTQSPFKGSAEPIGQGASSLIQEIQNVLPHPCNYRLEVYVFIEWLNSWGLHSISSGDTVVSNALGHFKEFDEPDLKCRLYNALVIYYQRKGVLSSAMKFSAAVISLAFSTGNTNMHSLGLCNLAWGEWKLGDYSAAQVHANEAQRLAIISADLYREAQALHIEAICYYRSGNYTKAMSLCIRARDLLGLCGSLQLWFCLLNIAEIDVLIGALKNDVQRNCDKARKMLDPVGDAEGVAISPPEGGKFLGSKDNPCKVSQSDSGILRNPNLLSGAAW
ncbi:P-loop containing nucleoside triphosphate hydrolase protein [Mycena leptocephala]|nr:P-loop containing nucleoside triphosphate hydrolase protein [Mycena leptocephala]